MMRKRDRIGEYLSECEQASLSNNTLRAYRTGLRAWEDSGLEPRKWLASLDVAPRTLNHRRMTLHTFFKWQRERGYAKDNPLEQIRPAKEPERLQRTLTVDECARLLDACDQLTDDRFFPGLPRTYFMRARMRAMVALQLTAGLRVSELCAIRLEDVAWPEKFVAGTVTITGKGNKQRRVRLSHVAREAIDAWLEYRPDSADLLFCSFEATPMQPRTYSRQLDAACWWAELPAIHPHVLRHTFASLAIEGGIPVADLQGMLGHAKITTTMGYVHRLSPDAPWQSVGDHPLGGLDAGNTSGTLDADATEED